MSNHARRRGSARAGATRRGPMPIFDATGRQVGWDLTDEDIAEVLAASFGPAAISESDHRPDRLDYIAVLSRDDLETIACYMSGYDPDALHAALLQLPSRSQGWAA